jgi:RNase P subunit RPR2
MNQTEDYATPTDWMCSNCDLPLEPSKVMVTYLGNSYPVQLMRCPKCGMVMVTEELAMGKMNEVEKALEDK